MNLSVCVFRYTTLHSLVEHWAGTPIIMKPAQAGEFGYFCVITLPPLFFFSLFYRLCGNLSSTTYTHTG